VVYAMRDGRERRPARPAHGDHGPEEPHVVARWFDRHRRVPNSDDIAQVCSPRRRSFSAVHGTRRIRSSSSRAFILRTFTTA
jgi:hypothetical protein